MMMSGKIVQSTVDALAVGRRQLFIALMLVLTLVVDGLDIQLLALVAPLILAELGIERAAFGPAMSAALIGMSIGAAAGGWCGDRYGRKAVLVASALCFGMATIAVGLSNSDYEIVVLRVLGGIGFGAAAPNAVAFVSEWLPSRTRARAIGLMSIGTPLGGMIGSVLLIGLLPALGWRGSFFLCGAVSLVIAITVFLAVPESPGFLFATGRSERAMSDLRKCLDTEVSTAASAAATVGSTRSRAADCLFNSPGQRFVVGCWMTFFGVSYVAYAFAAWTPILLTMHGFDVPHALQASFCFNLMAVAAAVVTGLVVDRTGSKSLMMSASALVLLSIGLTMAGLRVDEPGGGTCRHLIVLVAGGLAGGSTGAILATVYVVIVSGYPVARRSWGLGVGMMIGRAGGIASTFLGGTLLGIPGLGTRPYFLMLILCALTTVGGIALIDRHLRAQHRQMITLSHDQGVD